MLETIEELGGLRTVIVATDTPPRLLVVLLHGYAMTPGDLSPFAHSIAVPAHFLVPEGPVTAREGGRAWWDVDGEARSNALENGPRDLYAEHPAGADHARQRLLVFLDAVRRQWRDLPIALVGFSQGGMLACDLVLRSRPNAAALALLSSSRIAAESWEPVLARLNGLPVFISHGRNDADLAFSAGEALRDLAIRGGAHVSWVAHDQGHEIPLVVWRQLRTFLSGLA